MDIIVCIKQVQDPDIPPRDFKVDEEKMEILSPANISPVISTFDENAIEEAIALKEEYGGRTVFYYVDEKIGWCPRGNPYESEIQLKPEMAGNVTVMFKNSVGCWHTIEDVKVPSKTIIRKNFILVVHI